MKRFMIWMFVIILLLTGCRASNAASLRENVAIYQAHFLKPQEEVYATFHLDSDLKKPEWHLVDLDKPYQIADVTFNQNLEFGYITGTDIYLLGYHLVLELPSDDDSMQ